MGGSPSKGLGSGQVGYSISGWVKLSVQCVSSGNMRGVGAFARFELEGERTWSTYGWNSVAHCVGGTPHECTRSWQHDIIIEICMRPSSLNL